MGDNVIHRVIDLFQTTLGFFVLHRTGELLLPPGVVVDPEPGTYSTKRPVLLLKIRGEGIQDSILNVMNPGPAHGEEGVTLKRKHLPTHQVDYMGPDALNLPAAPFLRWVSGQPVEILMDPTDE